MTTRHHTYTEADTSGTVHLYSSYQRLGAVCVCSQRLLQLARTLLSFLINVVIELIMAVESRL